MSRSQSVGLIVIFVLAVASIFYGVSNFRKAFPEVDVPIIYDKAVASAKMDSTLLESGANPDNFRSVTVMSEAGKFFIDREFGSDTIRAIHLNEKIPVWKWTRRYFIPLQKEEYTIGVRPDDGKLVSFTHLVAESLSGADIPSDSAQIIAETFLQKQGYELADWQLKMSRTEKRPNRRDHWFTYELKDWELGDAKHWVSIAIWGDEVGEFSDYLHIPESWSREFVKTRTANLTFQRVDELFAFILAMFMLGYLILSFRRGKLAWKFGAILSAIVFGANIIMNLNLLPLSVFAYNTADNFTGFIFQKIMYAIVNGAVSGLIALVAGVAGERIYREFLPKFSYLPHLFSPSGWRTPQFRNAVIAGYLFAIVHIGFIVAFYVFGRKIGFWSPTQSNYTDLLSTYLPWLFPITLGIVSSITEDFAFRLFAVPYLSKLFKSTVVGVIIPAAIWGFLHSTYPQEPSYARGIEVGLIGVAAGWLMLRYGIVANLTWHFAVNAGLTAFYLLRQACIITIVLTILGFLLPVILIALGFIVGKRRTISTNEDMIPAAPVPPSVTKIPEPAPTYTPPPMSRKVIFGALALVGVIVAIIAPKYPYDVVRVGRKGVLQKSINLLTERDVPTDSFRTVTYLRSTAIGSEKRYVYQQAGWDGINALWGDAKWKPLYLWSARFFIPEEKNEYIVEFTPDGDAYTIMHFLEEGDSGAAISQDSALVLASKLVCEFGKGEVIDWELIEKTTMERPNRVDHYFTWQSEDSIGQAHRRVGVEVLGDEPAFSQIFLKRPEEWDRQDSKTTVITVVLRALPMVLMALLVVVIAITFGRNFVRRRISAKPLLWCAVIALLAYAVKYLNMLTTTMSSYFTAMPLNQYYILSAIGYTIGILFGAIVAVVAVGAFWGTDFRKKLYERIPAGENILLSAIAVFFMLGVFSLLRWLEIAVNMPLRNPSIIFPQGFDNWLPMLSVPASIVKRLFVSLPASFIAYIALRRKFGSGKKFVLAVVAVAIVLSLGNLKSTGELLWSIAKNLAVLLSGWALVKSIMKDNIPIYISTIFLAVPLQQALSWLTCAGNAFYLWNAVATAAIGISLWILYSIFASRYQGVRRRSLHPDDAAHTTD